MMVIYYCKKNGIKPRNLIADLIIKMELEGLADLICEITGVELGSKYEQFHSAEQAQALKLDKQFIKMHEYADEVKISLINFLVNLVKIIIGEEKDVTLLSS